MKVMFHVDLWSASSGRHYARLTVDLPFAPWDGMPIEQSAWKDTRDVVKTSLLLTEPDDPVVYCYMGKDDFETPDRLRQHAEMYRGHGWAIDGKPK